MRHKLLISGAFVVLALSLTGRAAEDSGSSAPASGSSSTLHTIVCHDAQNVPVTADPEQALPMQIVARLDCGAEVIVLSDSEGYTARIGTSDGQNGYVARMYLSKTPVNSARSRVAEATLDNGIARWHAGALGSDQFFSGDSLVESLTAKGVTVQVSLQDTDWKLRANVAIANNGSQVIRFNPAGFTLDELRPRLRSLAHQDPRDLAKAKTHQVYWTNVSAVAPSTPGDTTVAVGLQKAAFVSTPNYLAQDIAQSQPPVLAAGALAPKDKAAGVVWFERDKNPQQLTLRIFVDDEIFEFPLSFPPRN
jgi:hypothetical protein